MGVDFLERVKKTIKRSWDRERITLATSDLLTRQPEDGGRTVVGEIVANAKLSPGEKLTVEKDARGLVARRGLTDMVRITDAPPDVIRGVEESCGAGVGVIENVHEPAGVVEIKIC